MKAAVRWATVATLATLASATPASAQTLPAAKDIIAKHVAAVGGKDAISKITSMQQTASMEIPAMGMSAEMTMYSAAPNKSAAKTSIPGLGEMQQGYDGKVGYDMNPMQGPRLLTDAELKQAQDNSDFYANLLLSESSFSKMETLGEAEFAGEKAYKVKLVRTSGRESTNYFSVATGLMLGTEMTIESQMGTITATTTMSDYKPFGDIKVATKMQQTAGPQVINITITNVSLNNVPANAFDLPDAVKALIKP